MTKWLQTFDDYRIFVYQKRQELSFSKKMFLAVMMACVTGLFSQVSCPLPWTPVPITGQVFAVLLSGILLGNVWGGISQIFYLCGGVYGVPWFEGQSIGFSVLIGPSGGYLVGFILAASFIGYAVDRFVFIRNFWSMILLLSIATFGIIYGIGLLQLFVWGQWTGQNFDLLTLLNMGCFPFIMGDFIKIFAVTSLSKVILPKRPF